jgi:hypothetical protein
MITPWGFPYGSDGTIDASTMNYNKVDLTSVRPHTRVKQRKENRRTKFVVLKTLALTSTTAEVGDVPTLFAPTQWFERRLPCDVRPSAPPVPIQCPKERERLRQHTCGLEIQGKVSERASQEIGREDEPKLATVVVLSGVMSLRPGTTYQPH